jgi:hypothetical protein
MAVDALSICNSALIKIGVPKITSLSGTSKAAIVCNEQYSKKRDFLLCNYYWDFAQAQIALTADVTAPAFEWSYQFTLPTGYLKPYYIYPDYAKWTRVGEKIMSDQSTLNLVYIKQITDTTKFTTVFDEALAYAIAAELCYILIQSVTLASAMEAKMQDVLKDVKSIVSGEGTPPEIMDDTWLESRFQSSGRSSYFGNFRDF